jgi:ADP-ribosylglycohydrolase
MQFVLLGENHSGVYPGQFTDYSEMEISLLMGLYDGVAKRYLEWFHSSPFDIGISTSFALNNAKNAQDMVNNVYKYNQCSESNGSLMRCIPIAVYGIGKSKEILFDMSELDSSLTHYSNIVKIICKIYCFVISQILEWKMKSKKMHIQNLLDETQTILFENKDENHKIISWYNNITNNRYLFI